MISVFLWKKYSETYFNNERGIENAKTACENIEDCDSAGELEKKVKPKGEIYAIQFILGFE